MDKNTKLTVYGGVPTIIGLILFVILLFVLDNPDEKELFRRQANKHFRAICWKAKNKLSESFELDELDAESTKMIEELSEFRKWFLDNYEKVRKEKKGKTTSKEH